MSYMDEYNKLKKKRLQEEEKTSAKATNSGGSSYMNEYNRLRGQSILDSTTYSFVREPITPSKKDKDEETKSKKDEKKEAESKKEERKWFDTSVFDDGFQWSDIPKAVVGTNTDVSKNLWAGILGIGEKILDAAATVGTAMNQGSMMQAAQSEMIYNTISGKDIDGKTVLSNYQKAQDEAEKETAKFVAKDLYNEEEIARKIISDPVKILTGIDSEKDSLLGEKSDSLVQSGGQLLAQIGVNSFVPGSGMALMATTAFGSEAEGAFNNGATFDEAVLSSTISAGAEVLTERLGGISFGGKTLTDAAFEGLSRKMTSKIAKTLITSGKVAADMTAEGAEEILAGYMSAIGQKLTYMEDKEIEELFSNDEMLESFIGGVVLGGAGSVGSVIQAKSKGVDYVTGLTKNEQAVANKVYETELTKKEESGKVSSREKTKLYNKILADMEAGRIDTDTIESVLGGESYESYKSLTEQETAIKEEIEALENTPESQFTVKQRERLTVLREQLKGIDTKTAKSNLFSEVDKLTANDTKLRESYNERTRRGQAFEADLTKYDAKQQETIKKAVESGILNNTNRTHEFVDLVAKISADKGVPFDFTNNQKLKESGFAIDGKQVNGYVTKDGVTLNVNSAKSLDTVVGHEIAHVLEGTDLYTELQTAIVEYAKSKNDYQGRYDALTKLYENIEGANIDAELTAELVGDYLFTDTDFINNLSTNHRNVFEKVYDEIKYMLKVATAGSKEARELERVKKLFEEAYRNSGQVQKNTADSGVKYALETDVNGNVFVDVTEDIFDSNNGESVARTIQRVIAEKFNNLIEANGQKFQINKTTNDEFRRSESATKLMESSPVAYNDKLKTIANADEILTAAKNWIGEAAKHTRKDDIVEFGRGNVMYRVGENGYVADVLVGIRKNGSAVLYDLVNIYETNIAEAPVTMASNDNSQRRQDASADEKIPQDGEVVKPQYSLSEEANTKQKQLEIINATNPMWDDYHTGIRSVEDIRTWEEVLGLDDESEGQFVWGDFSREDAENALKNNSVTVYSSYPISNGTFVSTSYIQALEYAGGNKNSKVYSKKVPLDDVAWINGDEGQYAKVEGADSVAKDSNGNELSPAVQKRFANSKAVDENGNLKVVYHGTPNGEFTIFDKAKGNVEGDFGSGFYFTDNADDVYRNYEGGGPDFENKVARRAEQIQEDEDIEYSEAIERAREELYVGSNKFEVYLNIENPAIVGKTILFDLESYYEEYNREDYDSEEDWESDVEHRIADEIDTIIWEVEKNVDIYSTDGLAEVLWEAVNNGGIDVQTLKLNIEALYLEDSNGNLVSNEVTRQVIESLGYDGIIDNTVSSKFNMHLDEGTTHYIVFKPNQIKNVSNQNPTDNPDINLSLSGKGVVSTGRFLGKDIALETAPVAETTDAEAVEPDIAPVADAKVEDYAPGENLEEQLAKADETLESLDSETEALFRDYKEQKISDAEFQELYVDLDKRYTQARLEQEKLSAEMTDINNRKYESLDDSDIPPEAEAPYYGDVESIAPVDPFAERDMYDVGKRNVKAYMYENPEVKPFFQDAARGMLYDLHNGTRGERIFNEQVHYESGYEKGWMGTKRRTTSDIAELLDQWGYSYAKIEAGLNAIIEDNGKENNAVSKRIEFMLDQRLRNGYKDVDGRPIPADDGYVNLLKEKQFDDDRRESLDSFMEVADQYAPPAEEIAPLKVEPAMQGEQNVLDEFEQTEQEQVEQEQPEQVQTEQEQAPERLTRAKLHSQIVDRIKSVFTQKGYDFDEVLKNAKRMQGVSINDNTPQRVNDKTFGYEAGEVLNDLTFNKVALNESEGVKWLNKQVDTIRNLSKKYKIKPRSKESAAAQMYAEGFWVNDKNEIIAYGDAELAQDFPDVQVQNRIKALASDPVVRKFYDNTLSAINESRARNAYPEIPRLENYFLHFRALDDTFSKLGIPFNPNDIKANDLPTDINGTTIDRKPGQPFFTSAMHREGKRTSFDLLGGLERYANSAKNQIYHIDDIQTARALWGYIADRYGQAHGLENLDNMTFEEQQQHIQDVYDGHLSNYARFLMEYANNLAGKTALIDRGVEGLIGRRALQFINTVNMQTSRNQIGYSISSPLTNFIPTMEAIARTSKRDSIKAFAQTVSNVFHKDGFVENDPTLIRRKGADRFSKTLWEKMSDPGYILMGAVDNVTSEFIVRTKYNELTRKGMDSKQAHIKAGEWAMRVMGDRSLGQMPLLYNSKFMGLFTKYQLEVRNQLDSAFYDTYQEAKSSTKDIESQKAKNAVTAAKFAYKATQIAALNHVFGIAFEKIAGYNPAFDIISTITALFGWDDDEDDEDTFVDNLKQARDELLDDLPYVSIFTGGGRIPVSGAFPIQEALTGKDQYGNEKAFWQTLAEALPYYILPGGYSQIKKTAKGLGMFSDEHPVSGSYTSVNAFEDGYQFGDVTKTVLGTSTDGGNLRFPVEKTFGNVLQAGLFGQYASDNARDYFDNGRSPLKEKQIQEYIDVDIPIKDYWEYREGLAKQKTNEDKVDYIDSLDLPLSKKNILVNNVLDRKEDVDLADYGEYGSLEEFDFAVKYPEKYQFLEENGVTFDEYSNFDDDAKDAYNWAFQNPDKYTLSKAISDDVVEYKSYTKGLGEIAADKDENGKSINGSRKEKVFDYIESLPLDYGQKCILFKSQYKADDSMNMDIIEYLDSREDITYEEMVTILTELDFIVNGNNVYWD